MNYEDVEKESGRVRLRRLGTRLATHRSGHATGERRSVMATNELQQFIEVWDKEAQKTADLLRALPREQYDFRPDPEGRSLGELAWHLAEGDAYISYGIEQGGFTMSAQPPNIVRPRTVQELAPGYERIHREAVARVRKLKPEDLDRSIDFFT